MGSGVEHQRAFSHGGDHDGLDGVQAGFQRFDPASVAASIMATAGGDLDRLHEDNAGALTHIQHLSSTL